MAQAKINIPSGPLQEFCERYQIRRLALFGSALRDDFRSDSDIDLLVIFDPEALVTFMTLGRMQRELTSLFQRPVDLVPQAGLKQAIRDSILSNAQEIYAA